MPRKQFYDIGKDVYLFPGQCQLDSERNSPEEPVRQWCAHELIRGYGICITDIEFERQVKVGSKSYRIDVLVSRNGKPWVVVECKEPGHTKHEGGMAQAISYAAAQEIKAEFAVYTNGNAWNVQRCLHGEWVPVPDIPIPTADEARKPMEYLLRLSMALLEYGQDWAKSKDPYPQVGANVHNTLENLLSYILAVRLNVSLPDSLDSGAVSDMKSYCRFA